MVGEETLQDTYVHIGQNSETGHYVHMKNILKGF